MARISSKRPQTTRRPHGNRPHGGKRRKLSVAQIIVSIVAAFCALVLIMGLVRFVQWQHEISTVQNEQAAAARQYGFNPGDIISDGQFFNSNAMSQAEVQSFIDEQGASCSGTRCLKSMTFDTANRPADGLCSAYAGVKGESAAAIIDKSARACGPESESAADDAAEGAAARVGKQSHRFSVQGGDGAELPRRCQLRPSVCRILQSGVRRGETLPVLPRP
jgi:hypothetical protein